MSARNKESDVDELAAVRLTLGGHVQGVGFRPFVFRLADRYGLSGTVQNRLGEVEIVAAGAKRALQAFEEELLGCSPPLARPYLVAEQPCDFPSRWDFKILRSDASANPRVSVPPDYFTCDACLEELRDPRDRRFRYPFINCTQCGPRYTLIDRLPYDRPNTSMAAFELCPRCQAEYDDPLDRRFHAEPVGCSECGPRLQFHLHGVAEESQDPLAATVTALAAGRIIAVKGIGGYHLMCDASSDAAVAELRQRKGRPNKPLAVMFPMVGADGLAALGQHVVLSTQLAEGVTQPARPIVLAPRRSSSTLSRHLAPGLDELGVFLPYSPLHHLLLGDFNRPLVATSGNISGEPVLIDNRDAGSRLGGVADGFLHHNRDIIRPADDPVYRAIGGKLRPLRMGRGSAPLELRLTTPVAEPVLALGSQQKNTVALAWEDRVVISPHIGDMGSVRSMEVFGQVLEDLQRLYGVVAARLLYDAHPGYATHRWALVSGLPATAIFHHRAHASALMGDTQQQHPSLVMAWDGVGYGEDGSLWGGETFFGVPGDWQRVASLRSFSLPGGERAGREPWRSAAGLCWEAGVEFQPNVELAQLAYQAWQRKLNSPTTSAAGRLFDGFAALAAGISATSYEGQAPMQLEAACGGDGDVSPVALPFSRDAEGLWRTDWEPLLDIAADSNRSLAERARCFHLSLAQAIVDQARQFRHELGACRVGLTGGVFQNRVLTEATCRGLEAQGFSVLLAERVPGNDGGLSFGQVVEFAAGRTGH